MPWVKLTDDWYDDPKLVEAGDDGGWLWVKALSWSARNLTDGLIPPRQLLLLTTLPDAPTIAQRLVDLGLFELADGGGWIVANFHRFQPSRAEVLAKREADSERKQRGRRTMSARIPGGHDADSVRPVPGPVPVDNPSSISEIDSVLDAIADARLSAQQRTGAVRNPNAWRKRVRANLGTDAGLLAKVEDYTSRFEDDPRRVAEAIEGLRPTTGLAKRRLPDGDADSAIADLGVVAG